MKPTAYVCLVAFANADLLIQTVQSMLSSAKEYRIHLALYSHTQNAEVLEACRKVSYMVNHTEEHVCAFRNNKINCGLARTWNEFLHTYTAGRNRDWGQDTWIITNDDIVFGAGSFDTLCRLSVENRDYYALNPNGDGYSCQALNPILWETLGYFDENFFPAYYEDCDMSYRCELAGLKQLVCPHIGITHLGSQTTKRNPDIQAMCDIWVPKCAQYFYRKWGKGPCEEVYVVPFDAYEKDKPVPKFGLYMPYEQPYFGPPYDRTDYEEFIVNYA